MMRGRAAILLTGVLAAGVFSCRSLSYRQEASTAMIKESSFHYLDAPLEEAQTALARARAQLPATAQTRAASELAQVDQILHKLRDYYVPVTEVRQMIYDAERWLILQRPDYAAQRLQQAEKQLLDVTGRAGPELAAILRQPLAAIAEARGSLTTAPTESERQLQALGEHLNLMLLKGELVLAEVRFPTGVQK